MKYKTKSFKKDNYFILYTLDDYILRYFDNFNELSKIFNYKANDLVHEFNRYDTDRLVVVVDNTKYKLVTFTD